MSKDPTSEGDEDRQPASIIEKSGTCGRRGNIGGRGANVLLHDPLMSSSILQEGC